MDLVEETVAPERQLEDPDHLLVLARHHACHQDDQIDRYLELLVAGEKVADRNAKPAGLVDGDDRRRVVGELDVDGALLARLRVQQLEVAVGPDVAI